MNDSNLKNNMKMDFTEQLIQVEEEIKGMPNDILVRQPNENMLYDTNGKVLDENYIDNFKFNKVSGLTKKLDFNVLSKMEIETSPRIAEILSS